MATALKTLDQSFHLLPDELRRRVEFLAVDPEMGKDVIGCQISGHPIRSNCHGTVHYILNAPFAGRESPVEGEAPWSFDAGSRPGGVTLWDMKLLLECRCEEPQEPSPGDIVSFWMEYKGIYLPAHSGLLLDPKTGEMFEQILTGKEFRTFFVDSYSGGDVKYHRYDPSL